MTIYKVSNVVLQGASTDTKPTTYATGTIFIENNTGVVSEWNGTSWVSIVSPTKTETLTGKTISGSSNTITNIQNSSLSSNVVLNNQGNTYQTGFGQFFPTNTLCIIGGSFTTTFAVGSLSASQVLTLPLSTDTLIGRATTDTITNKTINASNNIITDTSTALGDILKSNGSKFVKLALGSANQVLTVNSGGTDFGWAAATGGGGGVSASSPNTWSAVQTYNDGDLLLENPLGTFGVTLKAGAQTAAQTFTFPVASSDTIMLLGATQTVTGKSLSGSSNTFTNIPSTALPATVVYTGQSNTFGAFDQILTAGNLKLSNSGFSAAITTGTLAGNITLTLPNSTDTIVGRATTDTLTNKTISGSNNTLTNIGAGSLPATIVYTGQTNTFGSFDQVIPTGNLKLLNSTFKAAITTGTLAANITLTLPSSTDTLVGRATTDTLTNKTLTTPVIASITNSTGTLNINSSGTLTLPNTTDTVVGRATTDTLTNKTVNATNNTITDTSTSAGDILKSNGTKFTKFGVGTANQVLTTNGSANDLAWNSFNAENTGTATGSATGSTATFTIAHGLGSTPYCAFVTVSSVLGSNIAFSYTYDSTNITVLFASNPLSGTITFQWKALA